MIWISFPLFFCYAFPTHSLDLSSFLLIFASLSTYFILPLLHFLLLGCLLLSSLPSPHLSSCLYTPLQTVISQVQPEQSDDLSSSLHPTHTHSYNTINIHNEIHKQHCTLTNYSSQLCLQPCLIPMLNSIFFLLLCCISLNFPFLHFEVFLFMNH